MALVGADLAQLHTWSSSSAARCRANCRHPERHEPEGPGEQLVLGGAQRRPVPQRLRPVRQQVRTAAQPDPRRRPRRPAASTCRPSSRPPAPPSDARPPLATGMPATPAGSGGRSRMSLRPGRGAGTLDERVLIAPDEVLESERSSVITGMVIARAWRDPGYLARLLSSPGKSWSRRVSTAPDGMAIRVFADTPGIRHIHLTSLTTEPEEMRPGAAGAAPAARGQRGPADPEHRAGAVPGRPAGAAGAARRSPTSRCCAGSPRARRLSPAGDVVQSMCGARSDGGGGGRGSRPRPPPARRRRRRPPPRRSPGRRGGGPRPTRRRRRRSW